MLDSINVLTISIFCRGNLLFGRSLPRNLRWLTFGHTLVLEFWVSQHHRVIVGISVGNAHGFPDRWRVQHSTPEQSGPTSPKPHYGSGQFKIGKCDCRVHYPVSNLLRGCGNNQSGGIPKYYIRPRIPCCKEKT